MKYLSLLIILIIFVSGCNNHKKEPKNTNSDVIKQEQVEEKYVDDNPIVVGIYENDYSLVKEYTTTKENFKDLLFSIYYTNVENLESRDQKYNWNKTYLEYKNIDNYKIGFSFSFYSGNEKIEKTILSPEIYAFEPYFYIYLYDDINQQNGVFYTHLEKSDVDENTIFSSIKIYLVDVDKITSPIEFTVFTYDSEDDFDQFNKYRGNSKYTVKINLI